MQITFSNCSRAEEAIRCIEDIKDRLKEAGVPPMLVTIHVYGRIINISIQYNNDCVKGSFDIDSLERWHERDFNNMLMAYNYVR